MTERRKRSQTKVGMALNKLIANVVYGKSSKFLFYVYIFSLIYFYYSQKIVERVRERLNVKFVRSERMLNRLSKLPEFKSSLIIDKRLVAVYLTPKKIKMDKPYCIGFTILEESVIHKLH